MREIQILEDKRGGFRTLMCCDGWQIAMFNAVQHEKLVSVHRHMETDEAFVLLSGQGTLVEGGHSEKPIWLQKTKMEQGKVYNIPKNVWHTHLLEAGSTLLIVENANTNAANSMVFACSEALPVTDGDAMDRTRVIPECSD